MVRSAIVGSDAGQPALGREQAARLASDKPETRCVALRNLSQMRAYEAADRVAGLLRDSTAEVRREAAMNLGRTGNRNHLAAS